MRASYLFKPFQIIICSRGPIFFLLSLWEALEGHIALYGSHGFPCPSQLHEVFGFGLPGPLPRDPAWAGADLAGAGGAQVRTNKAADTRRKQVC